MCCGPSLALLHPDNTVIQFKLIKMYIAVASYTETAVHSSHGGGTQNSDMHSDVYFEEKRRCDRRGQKEENSKLARKWPGKFVYHRKNSSKLIT